ncbi:hypothetical protein [Lacrimispora defluvii]|uniref:Uncharacterized protein n=1 Tax=Lacrimispora defluvii TaxID=2719233 RepID=A0ABX1W1S9_9FIRM|nr:hypothetical protein [Lacrimispora defluvii]NNJ32671.1 hypothetical protein [Lacrimispora defluvii]
MSKKFDQLFTTQQILAKYVATQNRLASSFYQSYKLSALDIQHPFTSIKFPRYKISAEMQAHYMSLYESLTYNKDYQKQLFTLQSRLSTLASAYKTINIYDKYVSVPKSLIPEDFVCEEIIDNTSKTTDKITETAEVSKKLSFSDALIVIQILIDVLIFTITFIQTSQGSLQEQKNHNEQIAVEIEYNKIQEERNQILQKQVNAIEKQAEYLMTIYYEVQQADLAFQESNSAFSDIDSTLLNPASPSQCSDSCQPIEADEPCDSDKRHTTD